jgi:CheY-specific phosphatase CheX
VPGRDFTNQVLEGVNYITVPASLGEDVVASMQGKISAWAELPAEMHVLDFKLAPPPPPAFFKAVQSFTDRLKAKNVNLISVNMNETLAKEVKRLGLESSFNRILNFPGDLYKKKALSDTELRRLLFRYLAQAAYAAVETTLQSTVTCDENYSARAEEVPLNQFDMISVININTDFLRAEFRLCSSAKVLERLARAMLGPETTIDNELMESMALELLNMIYGHAKSNLNDKESFRLVSAIPRLLRKNEFHRIKRSSSTQLTIMPMVTPMGSFYVEVDFGNTKPS